MFYGLNVDFSVKTSIPAPKTAFLGVQFRKVKIKLRIWLRKEGVALHLDCAKEGERDQQRAQAAQGRKRAAEVQDSFEAAWVHDTNIGYSRTGNEQITRKMSKNIHTRRPQNEPREAFFVKKATLTKFFGQKCA